MLYFGALKTNEMPKADFDALLITHIKNGALTEIRELIESQSKFNINAPITSQHETPLHIAALYGKADIVAYFLELKAKPNSLCKRLKTPLFYAVKMHQSAVIHQLLPFHNEWKDKEFIYAILQSWIESGDEAQFIDWVTTQKLETHLNITLLEYAIFNNRSQISAFIQKQLSLKQYDYTGEHITVKFPKALWFKNDQAIEYQLFGINNCHETTAIRELQSALEGNDRERIDKAIIPCFDLNTYPLYTFVYWQNTVHLVKKLLDTGYFNINAYHQGHTLLHRAAITRDKEMIRLLLKHGANINAYTTGQCELCVDYESDIDDKNSTWGVHEHCNALHLVLSKVTDPSDPEEKENILEIVKLLVEHKIAVNAKTREISNIYDEDDKKNRRLTGLLPLTQAKQLRLDHVATYLEQNGAKISVPGVAESKPGTLKYLNGLWTRVSSEGSRGNVKRLGKPIIRSFGLSPNRLFTKAYSALTLVIPAADNSSVINANPHSTLKKANTPPK